MSIVGDYDVKNVFNKILLGQEPCFKVHEDSQVLSFMDIFPESPGHVLVIPKGLRVRNFLEMPNAEVGDYMKKVHLIAHGVKDALKPDGIAISQYNGEEAGQTIYHMHFHIIPCYKGVNLKPHNSQKADVSELEKLSQRISESVKMQFAANRNAENLMEINL